MNLDQERVAWILLDALALGDGSAARKWKVSRRTVERYRSRMRSEPELAAIVEEKRAGTEVELSALRVRFLRKALTRLETKVDDPEASLHEIAGAVKIVGELHQVSEALSDERPDSPDPEAAEAAGRVGSEAHVEH